ncbi:MAG: hypothetical protein WAT39_03005 [Planctomycetota bacterium]
MRVGGTLVLLVAACAGAPPQHRGPITGEASADGRTFSCSQAGLFVATANGERWLGDPGCRPFALAAGTVGLLVGGGDPAQSGELALCDFDGTVRARARVADDLVYTVAISPDGRTGVAGCADGRVLLVSLPDLAVQPSAFRHAGPALAVAFSPDGALLASGGHDGLVLLGAAGGGVAPRRLTDHTGPVTCLCWQDNGATFVSGARDGKVRLHDRSGRLVRTWARLPGPVARVAFAGDRIEYTAEAAPGMTSRGHLDPSAP